MINFYGIIQTRNHNYLLCANETINGDNHVVLSEDSYIFVDKDFNFLSFGEQWQYNNLVWREATNIYGQQWEELQQQYKTQLDNYREIISQRSSLRQYKDDLQGYHVVNEDSLLYKYLYNKFIKIWGLNTNGYYDNYEYCVNFDIDLSTKQYDIITQISGNYEEYRGRRGIVADSVNSYIKDIASSNGHGLYVDFGISFYIRRRKEIK